MLLSSDIVVNASIYYCFQGLYLPKYYYVPMEQIEQERANPIEMQYPNEYFYTITVDIPEGYILEGTESLVLNKKLEVDGKLLCKFESDFKIKDSKLIITINEFYRVNEFPKEYYEGFRAVINAASDFNKATILYNAE